MDRGQALVNALKSMVDQQSGTIASLAADLSVANARIAELQQAAKEPRKRKPKDPPTPAT